MAVLSGDRVVAGAVSAAAAALADYVFYVVPETPAGAAAFTARPSDPPPTDRWVGASSREERDGSPLGGSPAASAAAHPTDPTEGERGRSPGGGGRSPGSIGGSTTTPAPPCVLIVHSTASYRRLARGVPRFGELTVDVGAAHGDATTLMAQAAGTASVLGLDVSVKFVAAARKKHPGVRFEQLDALEDLAFLVRTDARRDR